jgi:hypothetical protein
MPELFVPRVMVPGTGTAVLGSVPGTNVPAAAAEVAAPAGWTVVTPAI